jgi:hypothetical protein
MFGRKQPPAPDAPLGGDDSSLPEDPQARKGRPTPSRKEAEAARKQQLRIPKDPKAAKKAARERERAERGKARAAMMAGDQGAAKSFTRDFVDSRFTVAEFFIFVAIAVLVLGFIQNPALQSFVSLAFFAFTAVIALDTIILLVTLNRRAAQKFPDKKDRRGITLYAILRALQLRRLRIPPPRVRRGGAPIERR